MVYMIMIMIMGTKRIVVTSSRDVIGHLTI